MCSNSNNNNISNSKLFNVTYLGSKEFWMLAITEQLKLCKQHIYRQKAAREKAKNNNTDFSTIFSTDNWLRDRKFFYLKIKQRLSSVRQPSVLTAYKNKLTFTNEQRDILYGCMLGDLSVRRAATNYSLKYSQSHIHKQYVGHLYDIFYNWCLTPPAPNLRTYVLHGKEYSQLQWQWDSISHPEITKLAESFYISKDPNSNIKTKTVPQYFIRDYITPRSVAYWFMDDGSKSDSTKNEGKGIMFATHGFSYNEVSYMSQELNTKCNWNTFVTKNKGKHVIVTSGRDYESFMELVYPYIHPSMYYKLPSKRK
uniref:Group I intronic ORF n=1 Tax=Volvocales sp. NrCl902 TaxID=2682054 RepID=A0A7G1GG89_9CHLO|nr:group I intronic ORF [Volvocales sp. NrCl902]